MEMVSVEGLVALLTLTSLEIVLGIDNIVFIAIVAGKLAEADREKARVVGLSLAIITRILLLCTLTWLMGLTTPLFSLVGHGFTGKDLILVGGGLFLMAKATHEIHGNIEHAGENEEHHRAKSGASFWGVIAQILVIDIIFSLDSVITAVGMVQHLPLMIIAILLSVGIMLVFSKAIVDFIHRYPTVKILALSFLLLVGLFLVMDGVGKHIEKGYIYFAMAFSLGVELVNIRIRRKVE